MTYPPNLIVPLKMVEREAIESALILCRGNISLAASRLEVSREKLYRMVRRWRAEENAEQAVNDEVLA